MSPYPTSESKRLLTAFQDSEFERQCKREGVMVLAMLAQSYTREPNQRKEARLEMAIADRLENKRDALTFCEFSRTWNKKTGEMP